MLCAILISLLASDNENKGEGTSVSCNIWTSRKQRLTLQREGGGERSSVVNAYNNHSENIHLNTTAFHRCYCAFQNVHGTKCWRLDFSTVCELVQHSVPGCFLAALGLRTCFGSVNNRLALLHILSLFSLYTAEICWYL